ncbi:TadE/TadG family type IV pilus assembly protein [Moorella sp. Hama-1]|uniref:TadE/TadG family type IV pilus assembly protein n=1 Tax=Moorella sp. Hama-1 TaxID=2138101 RepID=UPI0012906E34|nr:TadE family protein [Moorella sp. Hama-1]BCV20379.1 hypothetical protein hamaS1_04480 [Moorella sp. Hama-1]
MQDQKGITTLEVLLIAPFVLYFTLAGVMLVHLYVAKTVAISAAREAARTLAVYHDGIQARDKAKEVIANTLPVSKNGGQSAEVLNGPPPPESGTSQIGISSAPAPVKNYPGPFDPAADVKLYDDGTYCTAIVNYHADNFCPGLPVLINPGASFWSKWIDIPARAVFKREQI